MKHKGNQARRIVVKVGSSSLTDERGSLDNGKMSALVSQLAQVRNQGRQVVLVTSGAIRAGMERLELNKRPKNMPELQAAAAAGHSQLMHVYTQLLAEHGIVAAQVLLTRDDFDHRRRYLDARNTIYALLRLGCLPIVNENDTVATDEIRFGENDTLAALVAAGVGADLLLNLSDVDGLYSGVPGSGPDCCLIEEVTEIDDEIERIAGGPSDAGGSGGMKSKIESAKIATSSGVRVVIANASRPNVIVDVASGEKVGTRFLSSKVGLSHRKRWIAFGSRVKGSIIINDGARKVLVEQGKSLLSVGIAGCSGSFKVGDLVAVLDERAKEIARGLTNYDSDAVELIKGKRSSEIEKILGYKDYDEVIHRDNLVLGV